LIWRARKHPDAPLRDRQAAGCAQFQEEGSQWKATIRRFDAVVIATAHASIDMVQLHEWVDVVVDTRNALRAESSREKIWRA
jgi:UDP-N-acetyl-D-mannosaminuronate dehydrogenase